MARYKDSDIVKRAKRGDIVAFETLIRRHRGRVYNIAYRILKNREDAEDVVQETFVKVFQHLAGFQERSSFYTWIGRIAINLTLLKLRRRKRERNVLPLKGPIIDLSGGPEESLSRKELRKLLKASINSMPERMKKPFVLKEIEELPYRDIAKSLSISIPACKSRVHRARLYLRHKLADYFG
jgi:RNA polymerase sigma-70 factor (ECF subfamily)